MVYLKNVKTFIPVVSMVGDNCL